MKDKPGYSKHLLLEVDNQFINFLQQIILWSVKALALFMVIVIVWSTIDVGMVIVKNIFQPPYLLMPFEDIIHLFGAFLVVLIAIEIFLNIILYMRRDMDHIKLVVATALMAIARKVIILDYEKATAIQLYGIAGIIAALGVTYWLIRRPALNKDY